MIILIIFIIHIPLLDHLISIKFSLPCFYENDNFNKHFWCILSFLGPAMISTCASGLAPLGTIDCKINYLENIVVLFCSVLF